MIYTAHAPGGAVRIAIVSPHVSPTIVIPAKAGTTVTFGPFPTIVIPAEAGTTASIF